MKQENIWGEITPKQKEVQLAPDFVDVESAWQFIIDDRNKTVDELNSALDELDVANVEIKKLINAVVKLKEESDPMRGQLKQAEDLADKHISLIKDYNDLLKKNNSLADSLRSTLVLNTSLEAQKTTTSKMLKVANKDLKQVKSNLANQKKNNTTLSKRCERLTKENKELATNSVVDMPPFCCVYHVGDEQLYIFPQRHIMSNGDSIVEQTVLLYTDLMGVFLTTCLDDNNEAVFSSPLKPECTLSERTIETYSKNSISPSVEAREFATQWLYRVNIEQKTRVERADMIKFTGE